MPCNDGAQYAREEDNQRQRDKIDELTRLLCEACDLVHHSHELTARPASPELKHWYANHLIEDERRKAGERAAVAKSVTIKAALAKLTPEERRLLGLPDR